MERPLKLTSSRDQSVRSLGAPRCCYAATPARTHAGSPRALASTPCRARARHLPYACSLASTRRRARRAEASLRPVSSRARARDTESVPRAVAGPESAASSAVRLFFFFLARLLPASTALSTLRGERQQKLASRRVALARARKENCPETQPRHHQPRPYHWTVKSKNPLVLHLDASATLLGGGEVGGLGCSCANVAGGRVLGAARRGTATARRDRRACGQGRGGRLGAALQPQLWLGARPRAARSGGRAGRAGGGGRAGRSGGGRAGRRGGRACGGASTGGQDVGA
jgi:hypothetical protein